MAATAPSVRPGLADSLPALRPVEPERCLSPTAPLRPGRARRERRTGLVAVRHRLCQSQRRKRGGPLTGPNPTDRGKNGSKIHLITDRNGLPLSLGISGANMARQPRPEVAGAGDPTDPLPARPAPPATGQAPCQQGIRLRPPAPLAAQARYRTRYRPQRHQVLTAAGPPPLGRRKDGVLADRMPKPAPPL